MRRLRAATEEEAEILRPALWRRAIGTQWLLSGGILWQWLAQHRPFESLSLNFRFGWGAGGIVLGLALMAIAIQPQRRQLAAAPEAVERLRSRLAGVQKLLPSSREEWPLFAALACTAGICEELLFRGFVMWALAQVLPAYWQAAVAQGVLFGLAHAYQGARGVFLTCMVGLFLAGVVWLTGSLWPAMLVHALIDLNSGDLAIRIAELPATRRAKPA
jgi:membrane protease YdiL (CAAX protease family)